MNQLLAIPFPLRAAVLFAIGACAGRLVNLAVYRFCWAEKPLTSWARGRPGKRPWPGRRADRLPLFGWTTRAWRQTGQWRRPFVVELLTAILFVFVYWWEVEQLALHLGKANLPASWLHAQVLFHLVLLALMLVAALIDVDDRIIPDSVVVPGTLLGLAFAAAFPRALLPDVLPPPPVEFVQAFSPSAWPQAKWFDTSGLVWGLACFVAWCVALLPWRWRRHRGLWGTIALQLARFSRDQLSWLTLAMAALGSLGVTAVWWNGGVWWQGLLSGLIGMALSGGFTWSIRLIAGWVVGREAMGFGDVTLMAMLGASLGWQACLIVFFLAPFAGVVLAVLQWFFSGDKEIPYGPFLCLAAFALLLFWAPIWLEVGLVLRAPDLIAVILGFGLVMLAVLLGAWQWVRRLLPGRH